MRKDAAPRPCPEEGRAMSPEHTLVGAGVSELPRERGKSYPRPFQSLLFCWRERIEDTTGLLEGTGEA